MDNLTAEAGFWWWTFGTLVIAGGLYVLFRSVALVRGDQLAVLERRWLGRRMPEGRVVAMRHEVGVQAHILGPGLHFLTPFIYAVTKAPMLDVGEDEIALVEAIDGRPVDPGRIFAKVVSGHNLFQDGEAFLVQGGERGPQLEVIPPGLYRLNPYVATQQMSMFDAQKQAEERRREMENTKAQANLQPDLVKSEVAVQIATQRKQETIILADGEGQATRLAQEGLAAGITAVGRAEGEKIRAMGLAKAEAYAEQAQALGQTSLALVEVMQRIADGNVKITPDVLVSSGEGKPGEGNSVGGSGIMGAVLGNLLATQLAAARAPSGQAQKAQS